MKAKRCRFVGALTLSLAVLAASGLPNPVLAAESAQPVLQATITALDSIQEVDIRETTVDNIQRLGPNTVINGEIGRKADDGYVDGSDQFLLVLPTDGTLRTTFTVRDTGAATRANFNLTSGISGGYFFIINDQTTQSHSEAASKSLKAGSYYISIGSKNDTGFYYALSLAFDAEKYTEKEPNDNESQALLLGPGAAAGGNIGLVDTASHRDGSDFYSVAITEPGKLKIELDAYGQEGFMLGLGFSNRDTAASYIRDVKPGSSGTVTTGTLSPGTYWLYLGGMVQLSDGYGGSYRVTTTFTPDRPVNSVQALPSKSTVTVDGKPVAFQAYNIGGNNYFKLRDLAFALNGGAKPFNTVWNATRGAIVLTTGMPYVVSGGELTTSGGSGSVTAVPSAARLVANELQQAVQAYNIGGNNYFKLRDIGAIVNFSVTWNDVSKTVVIDTKQGYTAP